MSDMNLFQPDEVRIEPAPDRIEPVVWIRRLVIVERREPGITPIREILFHRGLNIINTHEATEADTEPVGHNVGKTLLARLIRFCLGEAHFADRATRAAIGKTFPFGYVLAEIIVNSECWCVARPIGHEAIRNAWAVQAEDWRVLLGDSEDFPKYETFRNAIEPAVLESLGQLKFPNAERPVRWLDLLAWMSRDQYCRYRHPYEWRAPEADSGTANPSMDDASFMVRACIGLLDDAEQKIIIDRRTATHNKEQLEQQYQHIGQRLEYVREHLIQQLELSDDAIGGPAFGHVAQQQAESRKKKLEGLLGDIVNDADLIALEQQTTEAAELLGEKTGELNQLRAQQTKDTARLEQAQTAGRDDFYAGFADPIANCPATDCPMQKETPAADGEPWRKQEIECLQTRVAQRDQQIAALENQKKSAHLNLKELDRRRVQRQAKVLKDKAGVERKIGVLDAITREGQQYREQHDKLDQMTEQRKKAEKRIEQLREQQRTAQKQLTQTQQQFQDYFTYVVKALVGQAVEGRLELTLRGLELMTLDESSSSTGEALSTSSKVLSLDLVSLIGSVCGVGTHPRLIIHDSPREADLEPHIYGRLFQLVREIEKITGDRVSFQYIVTTTTAPPPELSGKPHVVCSLHRRSDDGLLLGRRI